ncbi:MAG: hypothetical protein E6I08_11595 [Chloroflexi bacterium]|nr:MAG: hypothetical protein E6I08_11595 [Chloroflexota bacterium]
MVELGLNRAEPATLVVDLNCAFASIEQQHDPSLRGRPLAIAAYATDAATIVSSSREARDLGIKTGMRVFEAKALYPRLVIREPNPPRYREVSDKLIEILQRHTPDVLRMSIDEASLNLAGTPDLTRLGPEGVGWAIKRAVRAEVGEWVTCSIGIDATARHLARAGIRTPLDFLYATPQRLRLAGMRREVAEHWLKRLRGYEVGSFESARRKSYSHSHVMARATSVQADLEELLMRLSEMVGRRLRAAGRRGSVVTVSVVYRPRAGHFSHQAKQPQPISTGEEIYRAALELLAAREPNREIGTLGVGLSGLSDAAEDQMDLFAEPRAPRGDRLEKAMDTIRDRFGEDAVQRGRLLGRAPVVRDRIAFGNTGHPEE